MPFRFAPIVVAVSLATTLAACATSPIPVAENFELTSQKKVRSAGHWEILSRDVVSQTTAFLEASGVGSSMPMFVKEPANASQFDKAFSQFLVTELVQRGKTIRSDARAAVEVSYETLVIRHESERPRFVPGMYTMLTSGLYAAYGLRGEYLDVKLAAGLALAGLADYAASTNAGGPTHTELILTTTISTGGQYLARKTDVYYVEESDVSLFAQTQPAPTWTSKRLEVVGE